MGILPTRSSDRWHSKPGNFDTLHTTMIFEGNDLYGIPCLPHVPLSAIPDWLVPYRTRIHRTGGTTGGGVHFFLDDYRFETTWSRPEKALQYLSQFRCVLTPDFSLYPGWPLATQIWNVYRSRWCGAYWSTLGFQVIPTMSWSDRNSYGFSFSGIARHSVVAVSQVGVRKADQSRFVYGFREMIERIAPSQVLAYGRLPPELESKVAVRYYPTYWELRKGELSGG